MNGSLVGTKWELYRIHGKRGHSPVNWKSTRPVVRRLRWERLVFRMIQTHEAALAVTTGQPRHAGLPMIELGPVVEPLNVSH